MPSNAFMQATSTHSFNKFDLTTAGKNVESPHVSQSRLIPAFFSLSKRCKTTLVSYIPTSLVEVGKNLEFPQISRACNFDTFTYKMPCFLFVFEGNAEPQKTF